MLQGSKHNNGWRLTPDTNPKCITYNFWTKGIRFTVLLYVTVSWCSNEWMEWKYMENEYILNQCTAVRLGFICCFWWNDLIKWLDIPILLITLWTGEVLLQSVYILRLHVHLYFLSFFHNFYKALNPHLKSKEVTLTKMRFTIKTCNLS